MIAGYGKIKRHLKNIYDGSELSELSGENLLDILQNGELLKNKITTFVVLATDYAAVGQDSKLLRDAMNQSTEKVNFVLIAETEALLASKAPTNENISVVIEKSKKSDVLKKIVDKHIMEVIPNVERDNSVKEEISQDEVKQSEDEPEEHVTNDSLDGKLELKKEKEPQIELKKNEQIDTYKKEENQQIDEPKQVESVPSLWFPLVELPDYKPLVLNKPEDIVSYLIRRWG